MHDACVHLLSIVSNDVPACGYSKLQCASAHGIQLLLFFVARRMKLVSKVKKPVLGLTVETILYYNMNPHMQEWAKLHGPFRRLFLQIQQWST